MSDRRPRSPAAYAGAGTDLLTATPRQTDINRAPPQRRRIDLSLLGTGEIDAAERPRLGVTLVNSWWPTATFALSLQLGFARGLGFTAPDGSVHTDSFIIAFGALLPVIERTHAGLEAGVAARLSRTLVRGAAYADATGYHGAFSAFGGQAELSGWWAPGADASSPRWALTSHLGVGGWLADVDTLDGAEHLKLQRSPFVSFGLGVTVQIP